MWRAKRIAVVGAVVVFVGGVTFWIIGSSFIRPCNHAVGPTPKDLPVEVVHFPSQSGTNIAGWFVDTTPRRAAVVLLHPSGGDRTSMNTRARFLHHAGYATLAIDLRAHGESLAGERSWGWYESRDAISAVAWLRHRLPETKIAVLGTSLGGASALLAKEELHADALIAEAVFGNLRSAVWNRVKMRLGTLAADALSPLLAVQVPLRLGLDIDEIAPEKAAAFVRCPALLIHGELDQHARLSEGRAIFEAIPRTDKQWWQLPGAAHVDLCKFGGEEYARKVLTFLDDALNHPRPQHALRIAK